MAPTAKLDVVHRRLSALGMRHDVVELQEPTLNATPRRTRKAQRPPSRSHTARLTDAGMWRDPALLPRRRREDSRLVAPVFFLHEQHTPVGPARFAYLPLPSVERRRDGPPEVAGAIRRILVASFDPACRPDVDWAARGLGGEDLIDEATGEVTAVLSLLPRSEAIVARYTARAAVWTSVTPVVLPGYDDPGHYRDRLKKSTSPEVQRDLLGKIDQRVEGLLRKAIVQAGFARVLAEHASIDWRATGFFPGVDRADRYGVPDHLRRFPRLHVPIEWRDASGRRLQVPGPICLGGGRFVGWACCSRSVRPVL